MSTGLPVTSVTWKMSLALPPFVEISALLIFTLFSLNILVMSARSPTRSSASNSSSSPCKTRQDTLVSSYNHA
uniref:Uncharacterized protein MANES_04G088400 n=1 Tax=Rhizophora mucronata TaxID=61149 RepID=A0A2P2KTX9_RHIMU